MRVSSRISYAWFLQPSIAVVEMKKSWMCCTVRTCAVLGRSRVTMHSRLPVLAESKRDRNGLVGCLRLRALRGDVVGDVCRLVPAWRW